MSKYLEMPWNIEDTIQNLIELKEGIKEAAIAVNLHGKGKQDAEEIEYDFDRAIKALEEIQQYREIGTVEKIKEELDRLRNDNECQGLYFTFEERQDLARQHKELEAYRSIGTLEECRVAVEKQKPKKPIIENEQTQDCVTEVEWKCPVCGTQYVESSPCGEWCRYCGQRLYWSDPDDKLV